MEYEIGKLNSEQLAPVLCTEGAILVTAGAGSGKTRVLTHRIAYLINEKGVMPYNILAITFTNKAAREMSERLENMVSNSCDIWVSTFHSMCVRILRSTITKLGYSSNFSIYAESEKKRMVKAAISAVCAIGDDETSSNDDLLSSAMDVISSAKNMGISVEDFEDVFSNTCDRELYARIYAEYEKSMKSNNALDFDDLLVKTKQILILDQAAREYYQNKFKYIHVDEFQDTNTIQYDLVKILAGKHKNICVVGDEDQCIYGWRGANISNIKNFIGDFGSKVFKLEQNYRSTKSILSLANMLIDNNVSRIYKKLWTDNPQGEKVTDYTATSDSNEADYVLSVIQSLVRRGYSYGDFAILMRLNALTRPFEQRFMQYDIPSKVYGGFKFFDRKEIKDVFAYLRIVVNSSDDEAVMRVINFPKRGIGESSVKQLANYCAVSGMSMADVIADIDNNPDLPVSLIRKISPFALTLKLLKDNVDKLSISKLVTYLYNLLDFKTLYADKTEENESRKMNLRELLTSIQEYERENPQASLADYMQAMTLWTDLDADDTGNDSVTLATVHSAKGLEYKVVFVVGLEEGIFPASKSMSDENEIEEERRLMYVAITRAKERLYLTHSRTRFMYGKYKDSIPSRFLSEIGFDQPKPQRIERKFESYNSSMYDEDSSYDYSYPSRQRTVYERKDYSIKPNNAVKNLSGYKVGVKVMHKKFGEGVIVSLTSDVGNPFAEIDFAKFGKMTLALKYAPLELSEEM